MANQNCFNLDQLHFWGGLETARGSISAMIKHFQGFLNCWKVELIPQCWAWEKQQTIVNFLLIWSFLFISIVSQTKGEEAFVKEEFLEEILELGLFINYVFWQKKWKRSRILKKIKKNGRNLKNLRKNIWKKNL